MARISTAPTPFDDCTKEELHDWLSNPVTEKLVAGIKQHIAELESYILDATNAQFSDADMASKLRTMLIARADRSMVIDWITGANRA